MVIQIVMIKIERSSAHTAQKLLRAGPDPEGRGLPALKYKENLGSFCQDLI
jgi:hypothetical protein